MDSPDRRRRLHHRAGGWLRQHKKIGSFSLIAVLVAVVAAQFLYPHDRALPLAQMDGEAVGYRKDSDLLSSLQTTFTSSKVTLTTGDTSVTKTLAELGATPNTERMAQSLTAYSWQQRLMPFSILFLRPHLDSLDVYFSQAQLQAVASAIAQQLSTAPRDARLAIKDGKLVVTSAAEGRTVTADEIAGQLTSSKLGFTTTNLAIVGEAKPADYTDADIAPVRQQAEAMIGRHITLTEPSEHQLVPDAATLASWITLKAKADHSMALSIDRAAVTKYVAKINTDLAVPAGTTMVTLLDGRETSRQTGKSGQAVAAKPLIDGLMQAMSDETASRQLSVQLVAVAPQVVYNRRYSSTETGLRAYVQYVTSTEDIHISLAQLDGNHWTASGRASDSIPAASTYKLYVAMILFDKINKGEIKWSDKMLGTDVSTCVEQMIVLSLNECAEQFIADFGRPYIDSFLHARGISSATTFTSQGAVRTSAADLLVTLQGLANGTLYTGQNRDILLDKMGRQVYRNGVPAGSGGTVQDKVGFLWGYLHDAAVVHTSKGSYAVAIMTNNASWARIAQITTQLERIMYP